MKRLRKDFCNLSDHNSMALSMLQQCKLLPSLRKMSMSYKDFEREMLMSEQYSFYVALEGKIKCTLCTKNS